MTPLTARKIIATPEFRKMHSSWAADKQTKEILTVLRALLCRPVFISIEHITAERGIFANAFSAGSTAVLDACEDIDELSLPQEQVEEKFGSEK